MEIQRKKWDLDTPHHVRFFSPTAEFSNSGSSSDVDHENEWTPNKPRKDICRTPLSQVNRDFDVDDFYMEPKYFERHKRAKSCPSNKIRSAKKSTAPSHDYYLRVTPSRLSRVIVQSQEDYESDEYLDANEYIHDSFNLNEDGYHLGNRSIVMTSTARRPSSNQHRGSQVEIMSESRRSSYIVADSNINDENARPCVVQFPGNELSPVADRRSSYIVTESKLSSNEIPHTPTLRKSPRVLCKNSKEHGFKKDYKIYQMSKKLATEKNRIVKRLSNKHAIPRRNTVFQPFTLKTNERCPKRDLNCTSQKEVNFTSTLRHNTPKGKAKSPKLTKINPFHFNQSRKRQREDDDDNEKEYQPLAERVAAHFKTPTRYRSVSRLTVFKPTGKRYSPHLVRPHTPKLQAVKRKRAVTVLSHEQKMDLEAKQIKEYQFHAKPYNPEMANHPHVLKVEKKPPTKPESIELETEKRMMTRKYFEKQAEEPKYEFHAQKIPKGIFKGPVGLKDAKPLPVTHPKSPMFALKDRAEKWKAFCDMDTSSASVFRFKAKPAPIPKSPQFIKPTRRTTTFQPFSFDERDTERKVKKQKKIQEEIEKENTKFEFHAQEIPSSIFTPRPMRKVEKKAPTIPQPFNFQDATSSRYSLRCNDSAETTYTQNKPRFKAKPATVLKKEPFIPQKSLKPPIEFVEFSLNTENRAVAREQQKEERMSMNLERELAAQRYMEEKEQQEKEELRQLRKQLVHKAQPVRNYKPVHIKPSDKLPTDALSPQFATNRRRRRSN